MRAPLVLVASLLLLTACGGSPDPESDGGARRDASASDGGGGDAGPRPDGGRPTGDAGTPIPATCETSALFVATDGDDAADGSEATPFATIQHALDEATPGTTICVRAGTYAERLTPRVSGSAGAFITLMPYPGESVTLTGEGAGRGTEMNMIYLRDLSYFRVMGFTILGAGTVSDASGLRIFGAGDHLEILNNEISDIRGESAMGITVYGANGAGVTELRIEGNVVHDCEPAPSEALVVNGNVHRFRIVNNTVRDVNNIGIDVIGGEADISTEFPSMGLVAGNRVLRANSSYDGSAACIYSDGASDLIIERNDVSECDFGIEVGAENPGVVTRDVIVRNNFIHRNYRGGIIFGGYDVDRGRVEQSLFLNNTLYRNGRPGERTRYGFDGSDNGEVIVQWANNCRISNNILSGLPDTPELVSFWATGTMGIDFATNLAFNPGRPGSYPMGAGSMFADPLLVDPDAGDLHIQELSPAINMATSAPEIGEVDIDLDLRDWLGPDIGADELLTKI